MRTALLFATLGLLAPAARSQQPAPATAPAPAASVTTPAPAPSAVTPAPGPSIVTPGSAAAPAASGKPGEAPTVPTGETPEEAPAPTPETGVLAKVNVQGNRRVEADAIRAQLPLKPGDTYDKEKLKSTLLAVW